MRDVWIDFAKQLGLVKSPFLYYPCKLIKTILYKYSTRVMVNSPGFIPYISKIISEDKIKLIPNGVITDDFENIDQTSVEKLKITHIKEGKFNVIYTGNLGVANDIETLLDVAESLKDKKEIHFSFVGGGLKVAYFNNYIEKKNLPMCLFYRLFLKLKCPHYCL